MVKFEGGIFGPKIYSPQPNGPKRARGCSIWALWGNQNIIIIPSIPIVQESFLSGLPETVDEGDIPTIHEGVNADGQA